MIKKMSKLGSTIRPFWIGQSGQVGVIILLIMVVLLVMSLSIAARTTQHISLSQQQADSARVFNAAEIGLEEALSSEQLSLGTDFSSSLELFSGEVSVDYSVSAVSVLETRVFEGVSVEVDVTGAVDGNGMRVIWSKESDCGTQDPASLLLTVYFDDAGTTRVRHKAIGACDRSDGFELAAGTSTDGFNWLYDLDLLTDDFKVRLKPVYNDTHLKVSGNGWILPTQNYNIRSEANSLQGDESRVVEVNRILPTAPSVLDYALYSGTTIVK